MCGIAGSIRFSGDATPGDTIAVGRMLQLQKHRGPDGDGLYQNGSVVLGHRRLAILDLSASGRQPMTNETGKIWVTFNGEIYNYREMRSDLVTAGHHFNSNSDTEVILHGYEQWGIRGTLQRLRGMFAFALYDQGAKARGDGAPYLFLARDRVGIKPLYYSKTADRLAFASEVKVLRDSGVCSGDIDLDGLVGFYSLGAVPAPLTFLKDVQCLLPGHFLEISQAGLRFEKYWDLSYEAGSRTTDLSAELEDAVNRHLLSDVPLGVFLSGGLDSAGIVAIASRSKEHALTTVTLNFNEKEFSEAATARQIADCFHTDHHEVLITDQDFVDEIPRIIQAMDQPTADGVNTFFVCREAKRLGLTVVLSGLGGDEVFFGYQHYLRLIARSSGIRRFADLPKILRNAIVPVAAIYGSFKGEERWKRFGYLPNQNLHEGLYLLLRGFSAPDQVMELLGVDRTRIDRVLEQALGGLCQEFENKHLDVNQFNFLEIKRYLHDQLLRDSDVFSMAHSLELRVPYLDHRIVEILTGVPPEDKISQQSNKPLLTKAVNHPLVSGLASSPKRGFTFPHDRWMRQRASTLEALALDGGLLDPKAVKKVWSGLRQGRMHWSRAWATVVAANLNRA